MAARTWSVIVSFWICGTHVYCPGVAVDERYSKTLIGTQHNATWHKKFLLSHDANAEQPPLVIHFPCRKWTLLSNRECYDDWISATGITVRNIKTKASDYYTDIHARIIDMQASRDYVGTLY